MREARSPCIKFKLSDADVDRATLKPLTPEQLKLENDKYPKDGRVPFIGYSISPQLPSSTNFWNRTEPPDGGRIWRLQIKAPFAI